MDDSMSFTVKLLGLFCLCIRTESYNKNFQLYYPNLQNTLLEEEITDNIPVLVSRYSRYERQTRFTGDYNGSMYVSHEFQNSHEPQNDDALSYETTTLKTGKRVATFVGVKKAEIVTPGMAGDNYRSQRKTAKANPKGKKRVRRVVYDRDDRLFIPITKKFGLREPFIFNVRVTNGCTGILISPKHVLTAAHCVHDQKDYVKQLKDIKVGFPTGEDEVEWVGVKNIKVSKGWIEGGRWYGPFYDYALLKLKKKHNRPYITLSISEENHHGAGEQISFTGFDDDKPSGTMWHRSCSVIEDDKTFLYHHCDAKAGSSGSGVYSWIYDEERQKWQRELVGVFSGYRIRSYDDYYIRVRSFNVAVRLTRLKYAQICKWLGKKMSKKICRDKIKAKRKFSFIDEFDNTQAKAPNALV